MTVEESYIQEEFYGAYLLGSLRDSPMFLVQDYHTGNRFAQASFGAFFFIIKFSETSRLNLNYSRTILMHSLLSSNLSLYILPRH